MTKHVQPPDTLFVSVDTIKEIERILPARPKDAPDHVSEYMGMKLVEVAGMSCHYMVAIAQECPDDLELGGGA